MLFLCSPSSSRRSRHRQSANILSWSHKGRDRRPERSYCIQHRSHNPNAARAVQARSWSAALVQRVGRELDVEDAQRYHDGRVESRTLGDGEDGVSLLGEVKSGVRKVECRNYGAGIECLIGENITVNFSIRTALLHSSLATVADRSA